MATILQSFDRSPLGAFIRSPLGARGVGQQQTGGLALLWNGGGDNDFRNAVGPYIINFMPDGINTDPSFDVGSLFQYGLVVVSRVTEDPHWWPEFLTAIGSGWRGRVILEFGVQSTVPGGISDQRRQWVAGKSSLTGMGLGSEIFTIAFALGRRIAKNDHLLTAGVIGDWPVNPIHTTLPIPPPNERIATEVTGGSRLYSSNTGNTTPPNLPVASEESNGRVSWVVCNDFMLTGNDPASSSNEIQFWHNLKNVAP